MFIGCSKADEPSCIQCYKDNQIIIDACNEDLGVINGHKIETVQEFELLFKPIYKWDYCEYSN